MGGRSWDITWLPTDVRGAYLHLYLIMDERDILDRRHQLYELARRSNPERWATSTRNWNPFGAKLLPMSPE